MPQLTHERRRYIAILLTSAVLQAGSFTAANASDPLNALPTSKEPAESRIKSLTAQELRAIQLPEGNDQIVFSVTMIPDPNSKPERDSAQDPEPFVRVLASGQIDCKNRSGFPESRRFIDTISKAELTWLMHLVVNECDIMSRTSRAIDDKYKQNSHGGLPPSASFLYHVAAGSLHADLVIPENALSFKPLRAKLELVPFSSLNTYVNFLIARAHLNPTERQPLLDQLNTKLLQEIPNAPPFTIEHLAFATSTQKVDLGAYFEQEYEIQPKKFRRINANFIRKEKDQNPSITINSMEFSKYRPFEN